MPLQTHFQGMKGHNTVMEKMGKITINDSTWFGATDFKGKKTLSPTSAIRLKVVSILYPLPFLLEGLFLSRWLVWQYCRLSTQRFGRQSLRSSSMGPLCLVIYSCESYVLNVVTTSQACHALSAMGKWSFPHAISWMFLSRWSTSPDIMSQENPSLKVRSVSPSRGPKFKTLSCLIGQLLVMSELLIFPMLCLSSLHQEEIFG
ncbi:hypothetical protein ACUYOF_09225 [Photobacterium ganghwense]|uniref:hypothetical protein n=1 Tax=Photobacterium ganghwense TaxID=320778 RepID=UPI004056570E